MTVEIGQRGFRMMRDVNVVVDFFTRVISAWDKLFLINLKWIL